MELAERDARQHELRSDSRSRSVRAREFPHDTAVKTAQRTRTGTSTDAIAAALVDNLLYLQAKLPQHATRNDWYMALAYTIRDRMLDRYIATLGRDDGDQHRQGGRVFLCRVP